MGVPAREFSLPAIIVDGMAKTPWGDLPVSDAHVHFFSHRFYSGLAKARNPDGRAADVGNLTGQEIPDEDPARLADRWVRELDRQGVERASLIASLPGDEGSVSAAVASHQDRFRGFFLLDPTQPDATDRVKSAVADPHLHCVCLFPAMHRYSVASDAIRPVLRAAADGGLAVFVHCGVLSVGIRKKLGLPSPFDMRCSNPVDLHPVALAFPPLRFIIPHFGAGYFREALMLADLCPNVYLDTSSSNNWMRYEGLTLDDVFRRALNVLGPERLLFGTDSSFFPRGWQAGVLAAQCDALQGLGVSESDARLILGGNFGRLFA